MNTRIALATLMLLASSATLAADAFTELDADGDGLLSAEESAKMPGLVDKWKELDANEDGSLDAKEFAASMEGMSGMDGMSGKDGMSGMDGMSGKDGMSGMEGDKKE